MTNDTTNRSTAHDNPVALVLGATGGVGERSPRGWPVRDTKCAPCTAMLPRRPKRHHSMTGSMETP